MSDAASSSPMKVSDLTPEQLDYWVARAKGIEVLYDNASDELTYKAAPSLPPRRWNPTRFWSQGGPIIEEAKIDLNWDTEGNNQWAASVEPDILAQGRSALEAAMRAFVQSRLGDEVGG